MSSTVTTATVAAATLAEQDPGLAAGFGLIAVVLLAVSLVVLEATATARRAGARRLRRGGPLAAAPLVAVFVVTLAIRLGE